MAKQNGYPLPDVVNPENTKCVVLRIPDDVNHIRAFWGHLYELGRWWNWDRDAAHTGTEAAQVWRHVWSDAMDLWIESGGTCPAELPTIYNNDCDSFGGGGCVDCPNDCAGNEGIMPLQMLHLNGVDYLAEICCGQETILYPVKPTTVSLVDGRPVISKLVDNLTSQDDQTVVTISDDNLSCLAGKAVPYLLGRAADYIETMFSILTTGFDALSNYDEAADIALVINDLLGGDAQQVIDVLTGHTIDEVKAAIISAETESAMEAAWTLTSGINRLQLVSWAARAPWTVDGIVIKPLLLYWATTSILWQYSQAVQGFAQECETGQTLDDVNEAFNDLLVYREIDTGSGIFPVYTIEIEQNLHSSALVWEAPIDWLPTGLESQALYFRYSTGAGSPGDGFYISSGYLYRAHITLQAAADHVVDGAAITTEAFDAAAVVWPDIVEVVANVAGTLQPTQVQKSDTTIDAVLHSVLVVGEEIV